MLIFLSLKRIITPVLVFASTKTQVQFGVRSSMVERRFVEADTRVQFSSDTPYINHAAI